jgi:inosine/xanthosine triphosphatase
LRTKAVIIVGSENPSKLEAVRLGFQAVFPKTSFEVLGLEVASAVSNQPMSDQETLDGAGNRALNAQKACPEADFWIGLEGGLSELPNGDLVSYAWIVVLGKEKQGKARTAAYLLPAEVCALVRSGMELGEADDLVFGKKNTKQTSGGVGLLTNGLIDRADLYAMAVKLALIPFVQDALF